MVAMVENLCLLPQLDTQMFVPAPESSADLAEALLVHYSFDLGGYKASELVDIWLKQYPDGWLRLAIVEALYQGRYKAISVQQILTMWHRRGQITYHFNMEFERLICSKFPQSLTSNTPPALPPVVERSTVQQVDTSLQHGYTQAKILPFRLENGQNKISPPQEYEEEIGNYSEQVATYSDYLSIQQPTIQHQQQKALPTSVNSPPIQQFTPKTNDASESFTSKLKAIGRGGGE